MNAAMVERYWSWVFRRVSITSATVHGPFGNCGVAGVLTDSTEETEEEDDKLLRDGPRW